MRKEDYFNKHKNLNIAQQELDRKYRVYLMEQEQINFQRALNYNQMLTSGMGGLIVNPLGSGTIVFNGTTSYVSAPADSTGTLWSSGETKFTVEWFQFMTDAGLTPRVFSDGTDTSASVGVSIEGGTLYLWPGAHFAFDLTTLPDGYLNVWLHIAIVYDSGNLTLYVNGNRVSTDTATYTSNDIINPFYIGWDNKVTRPTQNRFTGNITNFRWTNDSVYLGTTLTVPTSPLSSLPTTKLLLLGGLADNPVSDASGNVTFVNHLTTWSAATPFS